MGVKFLTRSRNVGVSAHVRCSSRHHASKAAQIIKVGLVTIKIILIVTFSKVND